MIGCFYREEASKSERKTKTKSAHRLHLSLLEEMWLQADWISSFCGVSVIGIVLFVSGECVYNATLWFNCIIALLRLYVRRCKGARPRTKRIKCAQNAKMTKTAIKNRTRGELRCRKNGRKQKFQERKGGNPTAANELRAEKRNEKSSENGEQNRFNGNFLCFVRY